MLEKRGIIKLYYPDKRYGFITPDNGGQDVWFSISESDKDEYSSLPRRSKVSYVEKSFNNKNQAFRIKIL